jgi:hypothetical protein
MWAVRVALQRPYSFVVLASLRNLDETLGDAFSSVAARPLIRSGPRGGFAIDPDQGDGDWSVSLGMRAAPPEPRAKAGFAPIWRNKFARRGMRDDERPAGEARELCGLRVLAQAQGVRGPMRPARAGDVGPPGRSRPLAADPRVAVVRRRRRRRGHADRCALRGLRLLAPAGERAPSHQPPRYADVLVGAGGNLRPSRTAPCVRAWTAIVLARHT